MRADLSSAHRILAIRLDNIGDVVMLGPALRSMKQALPQAEITLMVSPAGSLVGPMLPWVDDVMSWRAIWQDVSAELPLDPMRELKLAAILRRGHFDVAFIFTSFTQSPYPPAYACYLAGIPIRVGHSNEFGGSLLTHWTKPPPVEGHQVERNLALVEAAGFPVRDRYLELSLPVETRLRVGQLLLEIGLDPQAPYILLAPGASCAARRYDLERFGMVARVLADQAGLPILIVGSLREQETLAPVLAVTGKNSIHSLVGQTTLPEVAALISRASLVIANNSASLHLADAFRRPMVILYSGTEHESQWRPRNAPAHLLRQATDCSPCYRFKCPYGMECLDIQPKQVVQAALDLLATPAQPLTDILRTGRNAC